MARLERRPALPSGDLDDLAPSPRVTPGHWLLLALGAVRRRKWLAVLVFLAGIAAVAAYSKVRTPYYRVEAKVLAQRPQALPSVVRPSYEDQPTRSAWEIIHRRDNLLALVRDANLLKNVTPAVASGDEAKERVEDASTTEPHAMATLVKLLDERLLVETEDGTTITISLDWPDPQAAYDIVQAALRNFLEARHLQEITAIDEMISVLQGRAATLRNELDAAVEEARRSAARPAGAPVPRVRLPSEELVRLQSLLEAKQRAIRDVEELRLRRAADLQAQLDQAKNTLSDAHPTVVGLKREVEAASRETPQIQSLREAEREARKEYSARLGREGFPGTTAGLAPQLPVASPAPMGAEEPPSVRHARTQYDQIAARLNAAHVELDAARAAFKYRYNVIWPPQYPTEPVSPDARKLFGAGLIASLLLALAAAVLPDLWSGRIVQRWQVERSLDLPVIGEIRRNP